MVQPIDLHTEIARIDTTTRVQQVADRASLAAQQRHALEADERRTQTATNVVEKDEIDGEHLDSEYRRRAQYGQRRKRGRPEDTEHPATDEERMALPDRDEGGHLDVSV